MTLARFAVITGLYHEPETVTPEALRDSEDGTLRAFWQLIADAPFGESNARVSSLRDPLWRYLHRCIVSTITARGDSREWVTRPDLVYLRCLLTHRPCQLAHCLAQYMATFHTRDRRGDLWGGPYVTVMARCLGLYDQYALSRPIAPRRLDRASMTGMKILARFPGVGYRFSLVRGQIFAGLPVPPEVPLQGPIVPIAQAVDQPGNPAHDADAPPSPPPEDQEPQQQPRVFRAVRLPPATVELFREISATQRAMRRELDTLRDDVTWLVQCQIAQAQAGGFGLPPRPPPREYADEPAPGDAALGGDDMDHDAP